MYSAIDVADAKAKCRFWLLIRSFTVSRRFHHLEWRLQATLATRSLLSQVNEGPFYPQKILFGQVEPKVVTRLVLEKETGVEEEVLEMGAGEIFHSIVITIAIGARAGGGRPERCGR